MQPYDCPICGAIEGERHLSDCSLRGELVAVAYRPPSYTAVGRWVRRNRHTLERLRCIVVIDAQTGTMASGCDMLEATQEHARRHPKSSGQFLCIDHTPQTPRETYAWPWAYKLA